MRVGSAERFGLITTNSVTQTFNRRVVERHLEAAGKEDARALSIAFAIPDHPWVDGSDGADVRVAMTVGAPLSSMAEGSGVRLSVTSETRAEGGEIDVTLTRALGRIHADLSVGADVTEAQALDANSGLASRGLQLIGKGFIVKEDELESLGQHREGFSDHVRAYRNGRDLTATPRGVYVIDLFGLTEDEARAKLPEVHQHVLTHVKPSRDTNKRKSYREDWWIHGEARSEPARRTRWAEPLRRHRRDEQAPLVSLPASRDCARQQTRLHRDGRRLPPGHTLVAHPRRMGARDRQPPGSR